MYQCSQIGHAFGIGFTEDVGDDENQVFSCEKQRTVVLVKDSYAVFVRNDDSGWYIVMGVGGFTIAKRVLE